MIELAVSEQPMGDLRAARFSFEHEGERVPGTLFMPVEAEGLLPLVFIQHPLTSSKDDYFVREPSIMWARRGWVCVGIDAPYHGDRDEFDPMMLIRDPGEVQAVVEQFGEELERALELIAGRYPVDLGRMGYVGYSFGSMIGVPAVARDGQFRAAAFCLVGEGGLAGGAGPGAMLSLIH
ncbi:MAG: alpha/beta hydrolase family protein, partial [Tepidiformaceae bacterium]